MLALLCYAFSAVIAQSDPPAAPHPLPTPQWRPGYHYTPHKNWTNDPNGLIDVNNNSSGFCTSPKGCLVAIYTADQPVLKRESQFVAYSNDGGRSFTNYSGNPVIDLHMQDFRDPNVIWLKQQQEWLMTVALPNEHKVRFYGSHDLKSWELLSEFGGNQGDTRLIWECPFARKAPKPERSPLTGHPCRLY
jgi:sucrose-6-phosphate hydrolase SacC (GH32 family)